MTCQYHSHNLKHHKLAFCNHETQAKLYHNIQAIGPITGRRTHTETGGGGGGDTSN